MMSSHSHVNRLFVLAAAVGGLFAASASMMQAQGIVSDDFVGTNGATLQGRTPDLADLPGGTYTETGFSGTFNAAKIDTTVGNTAPGSQTGFNSAVYLNIASAGSYTKPARLTLSVDLRIGSITTDAGSYRGIGLGFFTTTPANGVESSTGFTGLTVVPNGTLYLVVNGTSTATSAPAPVGFSTGQFYTLTYSLNTTTGTLSNVFYNGVNDSSFFASATTSLTASNTNLFGFYGSTGVSNALYGYVDNLSLAAVPEPSAATWALGLLAVGGIGARLRRARRVAR